MWASLPCDLLVDIFRHLDATAVLRCAATCRPWRRAIIANASCLQPHPDRFNPNLLIGFFYRDWWCRYQAWLQYVPGPFQGLLAMDDDVSIDFSKHDEPLSSRDGFLLLRGGTNICLCNPLAGTCTFLSAAAFDKYDDGRNKCAYVLVTGHDYDGGGGDSSSAVRVLDRREARIRHQARWGPVKRSAKLDDGGLTVTKADMWSEPPGDVVVCHGGGSVYYRIIRVFTRHRSSARLRVFAIDMYTERTWTMELPEKHAEITDHDRFVLATSEDGRLSLISQLRDHQIEVWVLVGHGEWTLRRMINVQIPGCLKEDSVCLGIKGFCPRSGCLFGYINYYNKDLLLIDVNTGNLRLVQKFGVGYFDEYDGFMKWM
ncbi:hypothetical protein HU200_066230 [Digitaria exilis]|uniref:F-box domain-containing protein n=1 Tax=Digitaria exilis TaxID=1010633 RepID=A0A835A0J7_9POAL|nr:hypothetical protein HU200_066230 [Digitaria exilis]